MLIHLGRFIQPGSLHEAAELLREPGAYPVYGGGAALIRANPRAATSAIDLSALIRPECRAEGDKTYLSSTATLEAVRIYDPALGEAIRVDYPLTLRNALTLGDELLEARPNAMLLTVLYGLGARIDTPERGADDLIEIGRWYQMSRDERRKLVVQGVVIPHYPGAWRFAWERVSRTPADPSIVAAVAFVYTGEPNPGAYVVVCGLADHPLRYTTGMPSQISDYKGSAAYRTAMAETLAAMALRKAGQ